MSNYLRQPLSIEAVIYTSSCIYTKPSIQAAICIGTYLCTSYVLRQLSISTAK